MTKEITRKKNHAKFNFIMKFSKKGFTEYVYLLENELKTTFISYRRGYANLKELLAPSNIDNKEVKKRHYNGSC